MNFFLIICDDSVLNSNEWQLVGNMRAFENCWSEMTSFLKSAHFMNVHVFEAN